MAMLRLSPQARADLIGIGEYSLRTWGEAQTSRYLDSIQDCMERLIQNPMLGRACDEVRPGLRRIEEGRHVIFYRVKREWVVINRILHQSMLPHRRVQ